MHFPGIWIRGNLSASFDGYMQFSAVSFYNEYDLDCNGTRPCVATEELQARGCRMKALLTWCCLFDWSRSPNCFVRRGLPAGDNFEPRHASPASWLLQRHMRSCLVGCALQDSVNRCTAWPECQAVVVSMNRTRTYQASLPERCAQAPARYECFRSWHCPYQNTCAPW